MLLAIAAASAGSAFAEDNGAATAAPEAGADVNIVVTGTALKSIEEIGATTVAGSSVQSLSSSKGDINEIARTMTNVQFDSGEGAMTEDSIKNLRPAQISISGGRTYDNSFTIEGLSTNSVVNTTQDNPNHYIEIIAHPQTTFLNPSIVKSVTVYDSNVSARLGGFTGGVVEAEIIDPLPEYHGEIAYGYTSDAWAEELVDDEDKSDVMPEKTRFTRREYNIMGMSPIGKVGGDTALLVSYTREEATIENTQRMATYGINPRRSESLKESFASKLKHDFDPNTILKFTSIYTKYEEQYYTQSDRIQHNDGWLNKLEFTKDWDSFSLKAYAGYQFNDMTREDDTNYYNYINFGTESTDWVAEDWSSAGKGGWGDREQTQTDIPLGFIAEWRVFENSRLSFGADYNFTQVDSKRPVATSSYRQASSKGVTLNPQIISADGSDDPTVINGEQALNHMIYYPAYDITVKLNKADAWAEWTQEGTLAGMKWSYRAGLRYDSNDFLKNNDLAPRFTAQIHPLEWLSIFAGYNRYYAHDFVDYKLREAWPDTYIYRRNGTLNADGQLVYSSSDWYLYMHSKSASYSQADVKTPYADEATAGIQMTGKWGTVSVKYMDKRTRDEFALSQGILEEYIPEDDPTSTSYHRTYVITNDGFTNYESWTLSWEKQYGRHRFEINSTFSDTETSNNTYFDDYDEEYYREEVYYNGNVVTRKDIALVRENYATPTYVNFIWDSRWFSNRLFLTLNGRWNESYEYTDYTGSITVDGTKYNLYEDVDKPQNFVTNLNVNWIAWQSDYGQLAINTKIENLFNRLPNTEATKSNPYQEGRTVWLGIKYSY